MKIYKKPKRIFEGSGEVNVEESYYVPLENVTNTNKQNMKTMIDRGRYFSIFAPRQSGKTTLNDHFDNLYEKAALYKETFVEIVFNHVKYRAAHKEQSWLEQYGLIKDEQGILSRPKSIVTILPVHEKMGLPRYRENTWHRNQWKRVTW